MENINNNIAAYAIGGAALPLITAPFFTGNNISDPKIVLSILGITVASTAIGLAAGHIQRATARYLSDVEDAPITAGVAALAAFAIICPTVFFVSSQRHKIPEKRPVVSKGVSTPQSPNPGF